MTEPKKPSICIAERFTNMLDFTNGDAEMRVDLGSEYETHISNIIPGKKCVYILFSDSSVALLVEEKNLVVFSESISGVASVLESLVLEKYLTMDDLRKDAIHLGKIKCP